MRNNPLSGTDPDGHCCWDYIAGTVGGVLNIVPNTINAVNGVVNAGLSTFTSYQIPAMQPIQADTNASQAGNQTGEALQVALPVGDFSKGAQILENAAQGKAFQEAVAAEKAVTDTNVVQNVTIKTESGVKTVMDIVSKDASGNTALTEAKSSATARLTPNQTAAHPEIGQTGGTVVSQGKPGSLAAQKYLPPKSRW